jgi:cation transport regulator ChaC
MGSMSDEILRLRADETAVIGYGSLMLPASIGETLGRRYDGPFVRCHLVGWRRSWNISMPNAAFYFDTNGERVYPKKIVYLNVRPAAQSLMNCVVFIVRNDELRVMHKWEWIYRPISATAELRNVRVVGGTAILYVGRTENLVRHVENCREGAIRASYLRILDEAVRSSDSVFRAEFEQTTECVPTHLVIDDRFDSDRPDPWAIAGFSYRPSRLT